MQCQLTGSLGFMMKERCSMDETGSENICEQLEAIANKICTDYCKYPDIWDEEKEGTQLFESDICDKCPVNMLFI